MSEAGLPGFEASPWFGLFAPAGTPTAVIERLQAAAAKALAMDDVRRQFVQQGIEPMTESGAAFAALVKTDFTRWGDIVRKSGATVD